MWAHSCWWKTFQVSKGLILMFDSWLDWAETSRTMGEMILLMPIFSLTQTGCYGFVWHVFFDTGNSTSDVSSAVFYISSVFTANCQQYLIAGEKCWSRVAAMALWLLAISQDRTEASPFPPWGLWLGRALSSRAPSSSRAKCDIPLATSQCQGPCPASGSHVGCSCEQGRW